MMSPQPFVTGMLVLPLLGFAVNGALALVAPVRRAVATVVGPGVVALAFVAAVASFYAMTRPGAPEVTEVELFRWLAAGRLQVDATLRLDALSMLMALIVTGVSLPIHVFSIGYMRSDPGYARYFAYLNLFVFFMLLLVLAANLPVMFVGWEGVGLASYLLIGYWFNDREKADAGKKAFIVNRIGDAGFLVAMFLLFSSLGTLDFAEALAAAPGTLPYGGTAITAMTLLLFLGAAGKSAQIPLYVWLPDAMAGPTPVSALIHAATMVTAGVYLVARAAVLYVMAPASMIVVAGTGAVTAVFAATIAVSQYDIKRVLAYSTVSQLGYMFLAVGVGAFASGIFHLMTQAFFKALLFLGAGAVIHTLHGALHDAGSTRDAQDMRNMGGLRRRLPVTWLAMWTGTLAIVGVWPFAGFFSKDEILWQTRARATGPFTPWFTIFWILGLSAALLTALYMARLMVLTFHGESRLPSAAWRHVREVPLVMTVPLAILGILSLTGGWLNVAPGLGAAPVLGWVPGGPLLEEWLHPVFAPAEAVVASRLGSPTAEAAAGGTEVGWAWVSLSLAVATLGLASALLLRGTRRPAEESAEPVGLARVLYRKWYVDEIYDAIIVRPFGTLARWFWKLIDEGVIDAAVNGVGYGLRAFGWVGSRLQTGQVNTYAFAIVLGVLFLLTLLNW